VRGGRHVESRVMSLLIDNRNPETSPGSRRSVCGRRELASRHSAGITIGLYWRPEGDEITVEVSDELTGGSFVLEPSKRDALAAFYHPYGFREEEEVN
jgi:hypothetical protein